MKLKAFHIDSLYESPLTENYEIGVWDDFTPFKLNRLVDKLLNISGYLCEQSWNEFNSLPSNVRPMSLSLISGGSQYENSRLYRWSKIMKHLSLKSGMKNLTLKEFIQLMIIFSPRRPDSSHFILNQDHISHDREDLPLKLSLFIATNSKLMSKGSFKTECFQAPLLFKYSPSEVNFKIKADIEKMEDNLSLAKSHHDFRYINEENISEEMILRNISIYGDDKIIPCKEFLSEGCNRVSVNKFRHEVVCKLAFNQNSDRKLKDFFGDIPEVQTNQTPDIIIQTSLNKYVVIEVATIIVDDEANMRKTAILKYSKYVQTLVSIENYYMNFKDRKIVIDLYILVVSPGKIFFSDIKLRDFIKCEEEDLCNYFRQAAIQTDEFLCLMGHDRISERESDPDTFIRWKKILIDKIKNCSLRESLKENMLYKNVFIDEEKILSAQAKEGDEVNYNFEESDFQGVDIAEQARPREIFKLSKNLKEDLSQKKLLRFPAFYGSVEFSRDDFLDAQPEDELFTILRNIFVSSRGYQDERKIDGVFLDEYEAKFISRLAKKSSFEIAKEQEKDNVDNLLKIISEIGLSEKDQKFEGSIKRKKGWTFRHSTNLRREEEIKLRMNINKLTDKADSGKVLDWNTSTSDIDNFIRRFKSESNVTDSAFEDQGVWKKARDQSYDDQKFFSEKNLSYLHRFDHLKINKYLNFWSNVCLTISKSINHYNNKGEVLIKKVEGHNAYLVMHNPSVQGPVWFSVFSKLAHSIYEEKEDDNIFSKFWTDQDYYISNWISLAHSDLETFINSQEILLSLKSVSQTIFEEDSEEVFSFCFLALLEGKSKTCAELLNLRYFYMELMKTNDPKFQEPFKVVEKFDKNVRSRLHLWLWKRMDKMYKIRKYNDLTRFVNSAKEEDSEEEGEEIAESHSNLYKPINFITLNKCKNSRQSLFLSYLGVLKNKRDVEKKTDSKKMLNKILNQELKMQEISDWQWENDENLDIKVSRNTHQFSPKIVNLAFKRIWKKVSNKSGIKTKEKFFEDRVVPNLLKHTLDSVATFKSSTDKESCFFDELNLKSAEIKELNDKKARISKKFKFMDSLKVEEEKKKSKLICESVNLKNKSVKRVKLITSILNGVEKEVLTHPRVMMDVPKISSYLDKFLVSLFKKDQWGKLREIYVLDYESRLLSLFIETISRTFCELLENEMLTKGNSKDNPAKRHESKKRLKKLLINKFIEKASNFHGKNPSELMERIQTKTFHDASDRTTWCQQFINPLFACLLTELTPSYSHNLILNILNLHTLKNIQVPIDLIEMFLKNRDVVDIDEGINILKKEFLGELPIKLLTKKGSIWIRNESNMMQGILHFTSSLIHSAIMFEMENILLEASKYLESLGTKLAFSFTSRVSSDDASFSVDITLLNPKKSKFNFWQIYSGILKFHLLSLKHFCVEDSVKSTHFISNDLQEFNSEFQFGNTSVCPLVPHIMAANQIPSEIDPYKRMLEQMNTRCALLEKGTQGKDVMFVCYMQCLTHYKLLFGSTNPYNELAWKILNYMKVDQLGYFFLDDPQVGPLLGQSFNRYNVFLNNCEIQKKYLKFLMMSGIENLVENCLDTVFNWKKSRSHEIMLETIDKLMNEEFQIAGLDRDREIIGKRVRFDETESLQIKSIQTGLVDMTSIFRVSSSILEGKAKMFDKLNDSNLSRTMSFINKISIARVSSYFLNSACVRLKNNFRLDKNLTDELEAFSKTEHSYLSILCILFLLRHNDEISKPLERLGVFDYKMSKYFPLGLDYEKVISEKNSFCLEKPKQRFRIPRTKKMQIEVDKGSNSLLCSNYDIIKFQWYSISIKNQSTSNIISTWRTLKDNISWLKDSVDDTLSQIDCPFNSEKALISFFEKWHISGKRRINILGPFKAKRSLLGQISNFMSSNYDHNEFYTKPILLEEKMPDERLILWRELHQIPSLYKSVLLSKYEINRNFYKKVIPNLNTSSSEDKIKLVENIICYPEDISSYSMKNLLGQTLAGRSYDGKNELIIKILSHNKQICLELNKTGFFCFHIFGNLFNLEFECQQLIKSCKRKGLDLVHEYESKKRRPTCYFDISVMGLTEVSSKNIPIFESRKMIIQISNLTFNLRTEYKNDGVIVKQEFRSPPPQMREEYNVDPLFSFFCLELFKIPIKDLKLMNKMSNSEYVDSLIKNPINGVLKKRKLIQLMIYLLSIKKEDLNVRWKNLNFKMFSKFIFGEDSSYFDYEEEIKRYVRKLYSSFEFLMNRLEKLCNKKFKRDETEEDDQTEINLEKQIDFDLSLEDLNQMSHFHEMMMDQGLFDVDESENEQEFGADAELQIKEILGDFSILYDPNTLESKRRDNEKLSENLFLRSKFFELFPSDLQDMRKFFWGVFVQIKPELRNKFHENLKTWSPSLSEFIIFKMNRKPDEEELDYSLLD